jgi:uncharacterized membrane protein
MFVIPAWHPLFVHFPLALLVTAAVCLSLARALPVQRLAETSATVGTWNLCLGAVGVLFALGSGLAASIGLDVDAAAHQAIAAHVKSAVVTTMLTLSVAVWRGAGVAPTARPSPLFLAMMWLAIASLMVTGYRGGQNVYRHGVGVVRSIDEAPGH